MSTWQSPQCRDFLVDLRRYRRDQLEGSSLPDNPLWDLEIRLTAHSGRLCVLTSADEL